MLRQDVHNSSVRLVFFPLFGPWQLPAVHPPPAPAPHHSPAAGLERRSLSSPPHPAVRMASRGESTQCLHLGALNVTKLGQMLPTPHIFPAPTSSLSSVLCP